MDRAYLKKRGLGAWKDSGTWKLFLWTDTEAFQGDIAVAQDTLAALPTIESTVGACSLLPPQVPHVQCIVRALRSGNGAIDLSSTGCGKSICALVAAWNLGLTPVVICPKAVIGSWEAWSARTGVKIYVMNYESAIRSKLPFLKRTKKDKPAYFKMEWSMRNPERYLVVLDECQKCKGMETIQGAILSSIKRCKDLKVLCLSATIAQSPLDMKGLAYVLGWHTWDNWTSWLADNGCISTKQTVKKKQFNARTKSHWTSKFEINVWRFVGGEKSLANISKRLLPRYGSALTTEDLSEFFPRNRVIPVILKGDASVAQLHEEIQVKLKELAAQKRRDASANNQSILTELMRLQQEIELRKLPDAISMAKDAAEDGKSVVFIATFTATIDAFKEATKSLEISGKVSDKQGQIDAFQRDENHFIALQIQSGATGVSLHSDREEMRPRVSIMMPSFDSRLMLQALGRIFRANGKHDCLQHILLHKDSKIDQRLAEAIELKTGNISALNGYGAGLDLGINEYALDA